MSTPMSEPDTPGRGPHDGEYDAAHGNSLHRDARIGGSSIQARDVSGGVHIHHEGAGTPRQHLPPAPQLPVPRQLPPARAHFVDRHEDIRALDSARAAHPGEGPQLLVVSGFAGVGKTTFVSRWLRGLARDFPGGQLYADLGSHAPPGPARPDEVLEHFLRSLGATDVPVGLAERSALWRTLTADQPVAVMLDNAASAAQVRPLLPGSPGSLVIVTSRSQLSGLLVDGAVLHQLGLLTPEAAVELLSRGGGGGRTDEDPQAAIDVVTLCACLPLAVCLAAAQLAVRPAQPVAALAASLSRGRGPLDTLRAEGRSAVKAALDESYRLLSPGPARTYRRIGPLPATSYDRLLVAAVLACTAEEAEADLAALADAGLLEHTGQDTYRFHDLVRAHARRTGEADEAPAVQEAALRRYGDWCLHTATAAEELLTPSHTLDRTYVYPPAHPAPFVTEAEALDWLDTERDSLMHMVRHASTAGWHALCWQLADAMWPLFLRLRPSEAWIEAHELGLAAARRDGSHEGESRMLTSGGNGLRDAGRYEEAAEWYTVALRGAEEDGDRRREAQALNGLGNARLRLGELARAEAYFARAVTLREAVGHRRGTALTRIRLGEIATLRQQHARAVEHLTRAHADLTAEGDPYDAARALAFLGEARAQGGDREAGERELRDAYAAFQALASPRWQVRSLEMLGRIAQAAGELPRARDLYEEARQLSRPVSPAETRRLEERLREL
ncbi:tetratricopeptide repeat protein [Streptomyces iconiensis]|uniref:Tetratricopeptide repeat protein n=1 Tax=Streptomyces iconiensis TaxID=1384038 RepID=A0ABT7A314_9ACTN|nr:tetratricopeptide repeat protein [Streptomyces iconiensis]MDJ1135013.1 tetratricopeptide repeat protein [Streptomyces iconiensis]